MIDRLREEMEMTKTPVIRQTANSRKQKGKPKEEQEGDQNQTEEQKPAVVVDTEFMSLNYFAIKETKIPCTKGNKRNPLYCLGTRRQNFVCRD